MVNASTPWTVRTTKRRLPTSAPSPRKRHRNLESVEDGRISVPPKTRQQTLTQLQFLQHRSQDDEDDNFKPITTVPKRVPTKQNGTRLQKWNSRLTQMDFLSRPSICSGQEDDFPPLPDDSDIEIGDIQDRENSLIHLDGSQDAPNSRRRRSAPLTGKARRKRKETLVVSQESHDFKPVQRKRKTDGSMLDIPEYKRRTSNKTASLRATRSAGLFSAWQGEDHDDSLQGLESPSIKANTVAPCQQNPASQLQKPSRRTPTQENRPLSQDKLPDVALTRTPSKRKNVIPSSQSPESLSASTRATTSPSTVSHRLLIGRSPLKERSANAQLSRQMKDRKKLSPRRTKEPSPPKQKICVLKLSSHKLQQGRRLAEKGRALSKYSMRSPPYTSSRAGELEELPLIPVLDNKDRTEDPNPKSHVVEPMPFTALEVGDSEIESELEMSRAGQDNQKMAPVSSSSSEEMQETLPSLPILLGLRDLPGESVTLQESNDQSQLRHSGIAVKDFAVGNSSSRAAQSQKAGSEEGWQRTAVTKGETYVADTEDEESSVLVLSPGSSIANDTQFNAELAERVPTSSTDVSPSPSVTPSQRRCFLPSVQLDRENEPSLPRPNLVRRPTTYSTTKTVPLNDTSSSPSLPARSTPRSVYPASLPRPSQVSTQEPTQPYLPLSSMPLVPPSSPTRSGQATITIKDSSSVTGSLRDIPSHRRSQSEAQSRLTADPGLDDCLDAEDDNELNKELLPISHDVGTEIDELEDSQVVPVLVSVPVPVQISHTRDKDVEMSKTTEQGSPARRKRRPRKPVIPPEVRAVLGESLLESVPGPPGWSQRSWDDEPL